MNLHVINSKGEKTIMSWEELDSLNESKQEIYSHDIDWYLENGYSRIEDVINEFEEIVNDNHK